ncbi:HIT family protein [Domibacillus epiphyticus]|uniref:HIT domain-containing protein n=1 Tax=Domibacillus epiphyticus TaxID=1714355 RepID=A0A1V2A515_9BACI|nr:HIT domain-containing protein [Domibacillus epiphyticus]OMP66111.1 hypothetical protein BTO28_13990 [Domibacillus epiphyticus]
MKNCLICQKHANESIPFIYEHSLLQVYHGPIQSNILGYLYVEPKRHVESWCELTGEELNAVSQTIKYISFLLTHYYKAERVYTVVISEQVRHFHIHLIPRYKDQNAKGLKLIEKATQQKNAANPLLTQKEIDDCTLFLHSRLASLEVKKNGCRQNVSV